MTKPTPGDPKRSMTSVIHPATPVSDAPWADATMNEAAIR
jgi:hypothetical protein